MLREWIEKLMENHESIVHYPIVLLTTAFIFAVMGVLYKKALFKEIVFWNLLFGMITLGGAMASGFKEETGTDDPLLMESMDLHRRNAWLLSILVFFLTLWLGLRKRKMNGQEYLAWIAIFFIASSSAIYQGHNGFTVSMMKNVPVKSTAPLEKKEMDYGWNF